MEYIFVEVYNKYISFNRYSFVEFVELVDRRKSGIYFILVY
jgi:hypothetical protein